MPKIKKNLVFYTYLFVSILFFCSSNAEEFLPFQGEVIADNINIRLDSTVNSDVIYKVNKGQNLEVVSEFYDWYKVRLPVSADSFVRRDLVLRVDTRLAKVLRDRVNIRLKPSEKSPIIGRASKGEILNIVDVNGDWYKILPVRNSYGWLHKKFIKKIESVVKIDEMKTQDARTEGIDMAKRGEAVVAEVNPDQVNSKEINAEQKNLPQEQKVEETKSPYEDNQVCVIGILKPYGKVLGRPATHKVISIDKKIFLVKADEEKLRSLTYHKVKITGKLIYLPGQRYQLIEASGMEAMD